MPKSRGTSPKELKRRLRARAWQAREAVASARRTSEELAEARRLIDEVDKALLKAGVELVWLEDGTCKAQRKARTPKPASLPQNPQAGKPEIALGGDMSPDLPRSTPA